MKKMKIGFLATVILLAVAFTYGFISKNQQLTQPTTPTVGQSQVNMIPFDDAQHKASDGKTVFATYADVSKDLKEIRDNSDAIVVGKVESLKPTGSLSTVVTFNVSKTLKGKKYEKIEIYQMGTPEDPEVLKPENEYILFLGYQEKKEGNIFYIKGGHQGIGINKNGKIVLNDTVLQSDFEKNKKLNSKDDFSFLTEFINKK